MLAAAIAAVVTILATGVPAAAASGPVGPAPVSPLGRRGLCWQAWGNGSAITLARCVAGQNGQLWTFTSDGVLMNGNGYCLQGAPRASSLFLSFSGQCAGAASQQWTFSGSTNQIRNGPAGDCAYIQGGRPVAGAEIVARPCAAGVRGGAWSQGLSALALSAANPGPAPSSGSRSAARAFSADVTVTNAPRATTAYAAAVWFRLPRGLAVSSLAAGSGLPGWTCTLATVSCHGNLGPGGSGQVTVSGRVASGYTVATLAAHADVRHTDQQGRPVRAATVPVRVFAVVPAAQPAARGPMASGVAVSGLVIAGLLVTAGTALAFVTRRRQRAPIQLGIMPSTAPSPPLDR